MKYRALVSFTGTISMAMGGIREISDPALAGNLLKCGYIEEVKTKETTVETVTESESVEKVTEKRKVSKRKESKNNGN